MRRVHELQIKRSSRMLLVCSLALLAVIVAPGAIGLAHATNYTVSNSLVSTAAGFNGLNQKQSVTGAITPDPQIATGPTYIVEMVNHAMEIFTKQGSSNETCSLASFFSTGTDFISDPKVLYDAPSHRFFATIFDLTNSSVRIAVSKTNNPFVPSCVPSTWYSYPKIISPSSSLCLDQPILGINNDKVVVSANMYTNQCGTGAVYLGAEWWIINKNDLVTGSTTPRSVSFGPYPSLASVHPVVSLSSTSTEYMVSTGAQEIHTSTTTALLFSVTGIPGVSTVTNATISLTVQNITLPSNAYHPPDDMRVQSAVWFNGKAWFGLDTSCIPTGDTTTRGCIRLIQADTTALQIKQDFNLYVAGNDAFYSSLSTDSMGSLAVVYDYASGLSGPKIAVTGQAINDPADTLVQSTIIKASNTFNLSGNLGDYFGTAVDPTDPTIVWVIGEYVTSSLGHCGDFSSCWATYITDMRVRPTITVNNTTTFLGYSVTTNGTLTTNAPLNNLTLSGKITVSASNSSGLVFSKTYTVANVLIRNYTSGPPTAPYRAVLLLNVGVNSCPGYNVTCHLSSDNSISYDGASAIDTVTVSRNIDINQDGIVNNSDLSIVSASLYCNVGQACYNPQADVNADGTINAVDLATVSNFGNAPDYI